MAATRVYSTAAYYVAALIAILFGLSPKFGALVASVPGGVLGGITVVLYGMIGLLGAKIWKENNVDFANPINLVPVAAGIILGIGDLAGGQSLIPMLNMRLASPAHLVDINRRARSGRGSRSRRPRSGSARLVGTHSSNADTERVCRPPPAAPGAGQCVAHPAIRNRGTTVGSIAHADAAGEMPSVAVLTDAVIEAAARAGSREIPAHRVLRGALGDLPRRRRDRSIAVRFGRFPRHRHRLPRDRRDGTATMRWPGSRRR
jgi:hypothetical protein